MYAIKAQILFLLILDASISHARRLSHRAVREIRNEVLVYRSNVDLESRQGPKNYLTIVRGLLRSKSFAQDASQIPCDVVNTLETDVDAAEDLVTQLQQGQVPDLIQDLPQEVIENVKDVINIAVSLPTEILDAAESVVTDAVNVFNDIEDGSIVSDLAQIPGIVVSDVTAGWADFTSGLVDAWDDATSDIACFFGDCPTSAATAGSCAPATTTAGDFTTIYLPPTTTGSPTPTDVPLTATGVLTTIYVPPSTTEVFTPTYVLPSTNGVLTTIYVPTTTIDDGGGTAPSSTPYYFVVSSETAAQTPAIPSLSQDTATITPNSTVEPQPTPTPTAKTNTVQSASPPVAHQASSTTSALSAPASIAPKRVGLQSIQIFAMVLFGALAFLFVWL
ncbi:MAG: hypothetical protein Q9191_000696 [Dirinaria sp. TL-2023a]